MIWREVGDLNPRGIAPNGLAVHRLAGLGQPREKSIPADWFSFNYFSGPDLSDTNQEKSGIISGGWQELPNLDDDILHRQLTRG